MCDVAPKQLLAASTFCVLALFIINVISTEIDFNRMAPPGWGKWLTKRLGAQDGCDSDSHSPLPMLSHT